MARAQALVFPVAMTLIFVALAVAVNWLFITLAAGAALVGFERVWKSTSLRAHQRSRSTSDS